MRKLSLGLDSLVVDSFETHAAPLAPGTVEAHDAGTEPSNCATCDTCVGDNCPQPA
ncbi:MAG TPA: hypothetical protein VHG91_12875 [Longimicrobium sp.]|nr:hypothetical protein [Longimicrobium sp.]